MRKLAIAAGLLAITLPAQANPTLEGVASGLYNLEKTHAFLTWTVKHNGISGYTVNFTDFEADLVFDAGAPENSQLAVSINPAALNTNYPNAEKKVEWENELATDARFMNAGEFPAITFNSTSVEKTSDFEGKVTGDLTFLGVTKPVTLDVSYGNSGEHPLGQFIDYYKGEWVGVTATGTIVRSEWGLGFGAPITSDEVELFISAELKKN